MYYICKLVKDGVYSMINYMFWTGGWDSTFMLIQELRKGKEIQPIYLIDNDRNGSSNELKAMDIIYNKLKALNFLGGQMYNTIFVNKENIKNNDIITKAYYTIYEKTGLGSQHDWLSRYAEQENINIMLGTENGTPQTSHIIHALNDFCLLKKEEDIKIIDKEISSKEGKIVFGHMIFPIIDLYETDMLKLVEEWQLEDIMKEIWFCHTPINNEPCGICHPCEVKMESDMQFLLPSKAQNRYKHMKLFEKLFGNFGRKAYIKVIKIAKMK